MIDVVPEDFAEKGFDWSLRARLHIRWGSRSSGE